MIRVNYASFFVASLLACSTGTTSPGVSIPPDTSPPGSSAPVSSAPPRATTSAPAPDGVVEKTLWVKAERADCEGGEGPRKCLQVRDSKDGEWTLFYGTIEGFTREESYAYELRVQVEGAPPGRMDAPARRYRLTQIISKTKTAP